VFRIFKFKLYAVCVHFEAVCVHFEAAFEKDLIHRYLRSIPRAVKLSWLENAYSRPRFRRMILTRKVDHLVCDHGLLASLCVQDYKP